MNSGLNERMEGMEAAVVAQVLAGDRDAFRALVDAHSRSIFNLAYRMTGNQEDADEVVQETFLRAYKNLEKFELRSKFSTWVYRIAVNRCLDMLEKKKITGDYTISDDPDPEEHTVQVASTEAGPERQLLSREANEKIATAMKLLTPTERIAFTLRHMEGRSIEEISKTLKVKENAAKNTIFRAVKKLRVNLEPLVATR
jgi:RNA polymerase sigma-70 factor (ECF subfamily)